MIPICIPSYKNRERFRNELFTVLDKFDDVYLFVYDFDYKESGYDKLEFPSNVKVIQINIEKDFKKYDVNTTDLATKRNFIQDYMGKNNIDYYFALDDDTSIDNYFIINKSNEYKKISIVEYLEEMQRNVLSLKNEWCIISGKYVYPIGEDFENYNKSEKKFSKIKFKKDFAWCTTPLIINRKIIDEKNIRCKPKLVCDISLNFECLRNNLYPMYLRNLHSISNDVYFDNSTITEIFYKRYLLTFKEYPNCFHVSCSDGYDKEKIIFMLYPNEYKKILENMNEKEIKYKELFEYAKNNDLKNFIKCGEKMAEKMINKMSKKLSNDNIVEW